MGCVLTPRVLELLAYHDATSADSPSKTVEACDAYLNKYQDGKHEYDVLVLKAINSNKASISYNLPNDYLVVKEYNKVYSRNYFI